jgi:hypothetical protein
MSSIIPIKKESVSIEIDSVEPDEIIDLEPILLEVLEQQGVQEDMLYRGSAYGTYEDFKNRAIEHFKEPGTNSHFYTEFYCGYTSICFMVSASGEIYSWLSCLAAPPNKDSCVRHEGNISQY